MRLNNKTRTTKQMSSVHGTVVKLYFLFRCDIKFCPDFLLKT